MFFGSFGGIGSVVSSISNFTRGFSTFTNNLLNIPGFSQFSTQALNLLPGNFIKFVQGGIPILSNLTNLTNGINGVVSNFSNVLTNTATSYLNNLIGNNPIATTAFKVAGQLQNTVSQLNTSSLNFSNVVSKQLLQVLNTNFQGLQLGNINQAIESAFNSLNFSPKQIRDLNNPGVFQQTIKTLTDLSSSLISNTSQTMSYNQANISQFSGSGQFALQQLSQPQFSGNSDGFDLFARLGVYWAQGPGTDLNTASLNSAAGRKLIQDYSVAVDPSVIPPLSKVVIPNLGTRVAVDIGDAAKGAAPAGSIPTVFLFFNNKLEAEKYAQVAPPFVNLKVVPPGSKNNYTYYPDPPFGLL